jgi:hypothetical protein
MHRYASPRRGHCASCEIRMTGTPVYRMDEAYCCVGCAHGGPCVCTYEADIADDGVSGLGLLASPDATPSVPEPAQPVRIAVRGTLLQ